MKNIKKYLFFDIDNKWGNNIEKENPAIERNFDN